MSARCGHGSCTGFATLIFHAVIRSDRGRLLRVSGEPSPYNLELLRDLALARREPGRRIEVRSAPVLHPAFRRALASLERRGVVLVLED